MKWIALCVFVILSFCEAHDTLGFLQRYRKPHHRVWCLNDQFTCNPNQCVDNSVLCDGISDCDDGSDENPELCKSLNPRSCILPKQTEDKNYIVNCDKHSETKPGEYVEELSLLTFFCNLGYAKDYGDEHFQSFCLNSTWIPAIPSCTKMCTKLKNPHLKYSCFLNDKEVECSNDQYTFGTKLHLSCSLPYHHPDHDEIVCNDDGEWNIKHVKCVPECGRYSDEAEHLLKGNDLPWHVIVKRKNDDGSTYVFSGTLIAPNLVLTVGRSVADIHDKKLPPEDFEVVVNNYLDHEYQKSYDVKDTFFAPTGFLSKEDIALESDDIAILYLTKKVDIDATVLPVCVDWTGQKLLPGALPSAGKMVRIGDDYSFEKHDHNEIYTLPIEAYDLKTCIYKIPNGALQYDQFCGNISDLKMTGNSDWGSGYYVENPKEHLYYIKGIYRVTYGEEGIKVFTDVPTHIDWLSTIREKIEAIDDVEGHEYPYKDSADGECLHGDCEVKLVNHTSRHPLHYGSLELSCHEGELDMKFTHGCYLPFKNDSKFDYDIKCPFNPQNDLESLCKRTTEGASVPEYSTLNTHCKCGYATVSKKMEKSVCFNGHWLPEPEPCKKTCRKLKPEGVLLKCTYDGKPIECDDELIHGTYVASECLPGYAPEFPVKQAHLFCDEEGEWTGLLHRCVPVCGHAMMKDSNSSIDLKISYEEEFPWHVAIYDKTKDHELVCSGSIITENTIMTAAHCFYDSNDNKRNISDFVIAVGKISRDFKIKDTPKTQFYDIETLFMKNYYGEVWKYFNDLVIVKTKMKISFSPEVFPVCMQLDKQLPSGHLLQTAGWGSQDEGKFSTVLKISDLPYISLTECIQKAPLSAKQYILEDKSCLGRHNESMENFANSGSGIFYYDKHSLSYHIVGVANMKIHDYPFITVFTNTNYHAHWIRTTHGAILKLKH